MDFFFQTHGLCGHSPAHCLLTGYEAVLHALLFKGISNSTLCFQRLQQEGYTGSLSTIKRYISSHKSLIPAKRQHIALQPAFRTIITRL